MTMSVSVSDAPPAQTLTRYQRVAASGRTLLLDGEVGGALWKKVDQLIQRS